MPSITEHALIIQNSPIPGKPFEVFWIKKPQRVTHGSSLYVRLVSQLCIRSQPFIVLSSHDLKYSNRTIYLPTQSSHLIKINGPNIQFNLYCLVFIPLPPLGLEDHTW